jgi:uncharacterized membrane protein YheB (UPF0754 family)
MIKIPFIISREISFFELQKELDRIKKREENGGAPVTKHELPPHFRSYEDRIDEIYKNGLTKEKLQEILDDIESNLVSCELFPMPEKRNFLIKEIQSLIDGNYDDDMKNMTIRLIQEFGYNDAQVTHILKSAEDNILKSGDLLVFDRAESICKHLAKAN